MLTNEVKATIVATLHYTRGHVLLELNNWYDEHPDRATWLTEVAAIDAALAALDEQGEWQPLPDKIGYFEERGLTYSIFDNGAGFAVGMEQGGGHFAWPDDIRLCKRVPQKGNSNE